MYSPNGTASPLLLVDGRPARLLAWPFERADVCTSLGTNEPTGFRFAVEGAPVGARLELYAVLDKGVELVAESRLRRTVMSTHAIAQLERAAALSRRPDAVAITCWESGHNPIGRAKVLYDVAGLEHPTMLFAYQFSEFGDRLWAPLQETDTELVLIPWEWRDIYHALIRDLGVAFGTVWMCKPRLPTFTLAAQIADPDARLVLDMDDNEKHFSMSKASSTKVYGLPGLGQATMLMADTPARTVASRSLQRDFGGHLLRHARTEFSGRRPRRAGAATGESTVAFVGTVRPHKNLLAAAKSIGVLNWAEDRDVRFHVLGDVEPPAYREELVANGAVVGGVVPMGKLAKRLASMDVILTGYPSRQEGDEQITKYQISAKVGDALAVGKPVLVPSGPGVDDLAGTPGVFLFDETNFAQRLAQALDYQGPVGLPEEFTIEAAAVSFASALAEATVSPRAADVLGPLRRARDERGARLAEQDTLVLVWKQQDAGLYGRRVDQVARSYRRANPDSRVIVLELVSGQQQRAVAGLERDFTTDAALVLRLAEAKSGDGWVDGDGVTYIQLSGVDEATVEETVEQLFIRLVITPSNTRVVLFPVVELYPRLARLLNPYRMVCDVVDNQFGWTSDPARAQKMAMRYAVAVKSAQAVVFNSEVNRDFFASRGFVDAADPRVQVIPNWYRVPADFQAPTKPRFARPAPVVVYSGNMNDRVDWRLLTELADRTPDARIVLMGTASRVGVELAELLHRPNVSYLGALSERDCLGVLSTASVAVMPHVRNDVSSYMNPLKLKMYAAIGLPAVLSHVPGVDVDADLLDVVAREKFVDRVQTVLALGKDPSCEVHTSLTGADLDHEQRYLGLVRPVVPQAGRRVT